MVSVMLITFVVGFKSSQRTSHVKPLIEILTASLKKNIAKKLKVFSNDSSVEEKEDFTT